MRLSQIARAAAQSLSGRRYHDALAMLNTLQTRKSTSTDKDHQGMNPRDSMFAWLKYLNLDVSILDGSDIAIAMSDMYEISKVDFIHVAGTKGKGTACLYTEHLIDTYQRASSRNRRLGCLSSPHTTTVRDRIRIDREAVSETCFNTHFWTLWDRVAQSNSGYPPSLKYPSFITLLAFQIFVAEAVEVVVLETGVGGETDSTNVVLAPVATGITEIGYDHVNLLGNTIREITWHKAGILKENVPAFSVPQSTESTTELRKRAAEKGTEVQIVNHDYLVQHGITVMPNVRWQRDNASLALALAGRYAAHLLPPGEITPNVGRCVERTELPAKFEVIKQNEISWVLTSAHNEMSVDAACKVFLHIIQENPGCQTALIFGQYSPHRDVRKLLSLLTPRICSGGKRPFQLSIFCSQVMGSTSERPDLYDFRKSTHYLAVSRQEQVRIWEDLGNTGTVVEYATVTEAIEHVRRTKGETIVLVIGSQYVAGMARLVLTKDS